MVQYSSGEIKALLSKTNKTLVDRVCLTINDNEMVCLVGETGAGKTMIASDMMGLLAENIQAKESSLTIDLKIFNSKNRQKALGKEIVYIPQNGADCFSPSKKIKYHLYDSIKVAGYPLKEKEKIAKEVLEKVGFENPEKILNSYPFELSGGMAQKVCISISMLSKPKFVILDEPTNGMDEKAKFEFMDMVKSTFLNASILLITHDFSIVPYSTSLYVLLNGVVVEQGDTKSILENPKHPYTKALISSLPQNGLKALEETNETRDSKCPFFYRCPLAKEACLFEIEIKQEELHQWRCNDD